MTPNIDCQNQCLHCWRAIELKWNGKTEKIDTPQQIIKKSIKEQKIILSGFKGSKKTNKKKFQESFNPEHFAISLSGEPTLYPKLAELILELRKQRKTSFLVTNGLLPEKLIELKEKNALPTQLYVSLNAPNEKLFRKITKNKAENAWEKFNETLALLPKLKTRKVIRMTLVRELNMDEKVIEEYAKLIRKAQPDFVEVKGYISVGFARKRLGYDRMPSHEEIKDFSEKILKFLPKCKFLDEKIYSRVVLLGKNKSKMKIRKGEV